MQNENAEQPISIGKWMLDMFLSYLPFAGIIILIVWAVRGDVSSTKKNWAMARLLLTAIGIVLLFLFYVALAAFFIASGGITSIRTSSNSIASILG